MKKPGQWTEEDLSKLISLGIKESLEIDYKRCGSLDNSDKKKNEISKDVSAFANSAGGTIVYGMIEDGHVPTKIDSGFDPNDITKEWLEQVINSRIRRRITGLRVNQISLDETSPGKVAYVVNVPQSNHAPHQAADKRFYKRFNFESVPMEEYEIRDVSSRNKAPDLDLDYVFRPGNKEILLHRDDEHYYFPVNLKTAVFNQSHTVAQHAVFHLYIDSRIHVEKLPDDISVSNDVHQIRMDGETLQLNKFTMLWDDNRGLPLFEGITAELPSTGLNLKIPQNISNLFLRHTIGAPGMSTKDEYSIIAIENDIAKLKKLPFKEQSDT